GCVEPGRALETGHPLATSGGWLRPLTPARRGGHRRWRRGATHPPHPRTESPPRFRKGLPGLGAGADEHLVHRDAAIPGDHVGDGVRHVVGLELFHALYLPGHHLADLGPQWVSSSVSTMPGSTRATRTRLGRSSCRRDSLKAFTPNLVRE